jgi:hypothetical protein
MKGSRAVGVGLLLVAGGARAEEPPGVGVDAVASAPQVRRQSRRIYPRPLFDDLSVERRCTLKVAIDADGRPRDLAPADCPDDLVDWTVRRVRKDRWTPPAQDGAEALVEVVYVPPADAAELPAPDYWRRREGGACELRVAVEASGRVRLDSAPQACDPGLSDGDALPDAVFQRKSPTVCPITFVLAQGRPVDVDLFRCEVPTWPVVRDLLARWTWPTTDGPVPYTIQLRLEQAPEALERR